MRTQAIKLIKILTLLCFVLLYSNISICQNISWMEGLWKEDSGTPYHVPPVKCINTLEITTVADSSFTGIQTTFFAADTAVRVTYACHGLLTQNCLQFHRGDQMYKKNSNRVGYEWINCGVCDASICSLYVEHDKIFLLVSTKDCDSTCNGTITYYR